jgi:hypothetical protein
MTRFVQLHLLTSYPPANLNRDDLGPTQDRRDGRRDAAAHLFAVPQTRLAHLRPLQVRPGGACRHPYQGDG